ncbi:MAG: energy-coupling factor transporter ATPase [Firmicutes bacterium]|nr:energy-coupling factor transporter ATPase [Bacillota bacterium]MCL5780398.1 energy-coupling factor transporter ATPase [Bacillota bacterium]
MSLFKIENLIYYYPDSERPALNGVNLGIEEGEFLLVAGASGSGKSSLARVLAGLLPDFYGGRFGGHVYFKGREMRSIDRRKLARNVGMVFQDPEKQLVMTGVEAEIAFGLENLGLSQAEMFRRVAEVISFLDLTTLSQEFTANLSGGQKQKLTLAAVLAMQPQVLILDEPTSQLDPVAAEDFFNLVKRLNEEMGFTIVLIEQRLERCFHLADRVALMEGGRVVQDGAPEQVVRWAVKRGVPFIPPVARFFSMLGFPSIPVTIKEGRKQLRLSLRTGSFSNRSNFPLQEKGNAGTEPVQTPLVEIKNLWFTYANGKEALQNINFKISAGEFVAILGENGAGKSTLLKNMVGLLQPGRGKVLLRGDDLSENKEQYLGRRVAYLSQNPNDYLFQDTVEDELLFTLKNFGMEDDGIVDELLEGLHIGCYRQANPRDLSSGERQRVALASVLVTRPELLVLDEPTRGMDYRLKAELGSFLAGQAAAGVSVVLVTHDVEFAAEYASRVIMMFAGRIVSDGTRYETLGKSVFYSTQIGKLCRGFSDDVLTFHEAMEKIGPLLQERQIARAGNLNEGLV